MTHQELIAALEKATGPDRALNAEIYFYLNPHVRSGWIAPNGLGPEAHYARVSPNYTGSIDAAMGLPTSDWRWNSGDFSAERLRAYAIEGRFSVMLVLTGQQRVDWFARRAGMVDDTGDDDPLYISGVAKTLPAALCIAALKARALASGEG